MTPAAGIEIAAAVHIPSALGHGLGRLAGASTSAATEVGNSSAPAFTAAVGASSFRDGWQSLLSHWAGADQSTEESQKQPDSTKLSTGESSLNSTEPARDAVQTLPASLLDSTLPQSKPESDVPSSESQRQANLDLGTKTLPTISPKPVVSATIQPLKALIPSSLSATEQEISTSVTHLDTSATETQASKNRKSDSSRETSSHGNADVNSQAASVATASVVVPVQVAAPNQSSDPVTSQLSLTVQASPPAPIFALPSEPLKPATSVSTLDPTESNIPSPSATAPPASASSSAIQNDPNPGQAGRLSGESHAAKVSTGNETSEQSIASSTLSDPTSSSISTSASTTDQPASTATELELPAESFSTTSLNTGDLAAQPSIATTVRVPTPASENQPALQPGERSEPRSSLSATMDSHLSASSETEVSGMETATLPKQSSLVQTRAAGISASTPSPLDGTPATSFPTSEQKIQTPTDLSAEQNRTLLFHPASTPTATTFLSPPTHAASQAAAAPDLIDETGQQVNLAQSVFPASSNSVATASALQTSSVQEIIVPFHDFGQTQSTAAEKSTTSLLGAVAPVGTTTDQPTIASTAVTTATPTPPSARKTQDRPEPQLSASQLTESSASDPPQLVMAPVISPSSVRAIATGNNASEVQPMSAPVAAQVSSDATAATALTQTPVATPTPTDFDAGPSLPALSAAAIAVPETSTSPTSQLSAVSNPSPSSGTDTVPSPQGPSASSLVRGPSQAKASTATGLSPSVAGTQHPATSFNGVSASSLSAIASTAQSLSATQVFAQTSSSTEPTSGPQKPVNPAPVPLSAASDAAVLPPLASTITMPVAAALAVPTTPAPIAASIAPLNASVATVQATGRSNERAPKSGVGVATTTSSHTAQWASHTSEPQSVPTVAPVTPAGSTSPLGTAATLAAPQLETSSPGAGAAREVFAEMDSAAAAQSLTWTQAGTKSAEAGFHDPELGWVSVRADASSGGIHAALVPSSTEAAVALGGHLEGLNNYLAEHHNIVESLSVAAPESRPFNSGSDRGSDSSQQSSAQQEPNQGTGQQTSQGFGQNSSQRQSPSAVIQSSMGASTAAGLDTSPATAGFLSTTSESGTGTHISVLA